MRVRVLALGEDRRRHGRLILFLHVGDRLDLDHDAVERAVPRRRFRPVRRPVRAEEERKGTAFEADLGARLGGMRRQGPADGGAGTAPEQGRALVPCRVRTGKTVLAPER